MAEEEHIENDESAAAAIAPAQVEKPAHADLVAAVELALEHYRKTHTMKSEDDFKYPGFKEMFHALNS